MNPPKSNAAPSEVSRLQQWFQAVVTHPDGVEAGKLIALRPSELEKVVTRSRALTAGERLAIYANAYHTRLIECLGDVFPMLKRTLGEEAFDGFAFGYLQEYPSRSYTLNDLGEHFAQYLEETRPTDEELAEPDEADDDPVDLGDDWPGFLIDLARLECAIAEIFDGEGVEGRTSLQGDQLLGIPREQLPDVQLQTVPCLQLLATRFPVNDYYTAIRRAADEEPVALPAAAESFVALTRRDYIVRRYNLTRTEFELMRSIQAGEPVGRAIERAADVAEEGDEELAMNLERWFRNWTAEGFFCSVRS